jgi:uncharacterized protein
MTTVRQAVWFFVATFAFTWLLQAPGILAMRAHEIPSDGLMLMMGLGSAGPSLVALLFQWAERRFASGEPLPRATSSISWRLALFALIFPAGAHLLGSSVLRALGLYDAQHWLYPPRLSTEIAIAVVAPLGEEWGWRGYALPRLQARLSPWAASLWIGLVWNLWHVPTLFVPEARGVTPLELGLYLVAMLASSIIYTWLFNRSGGSLVGPLLAHLGIHLDNVFRASKMGDGILPLGSTTVVLVLLAGFLVARGELSHVDREFATPA